MATYVVLIKFTEQGIKKIKDTCKRASDFKANAKKLGVEVKEHLWCQGGFDGLAILEAPDDETAAAATLAVSTMGNVSTQTMRCFTAAEMTKIVSKLP